MGGGTSRAIATGLGCGLVCGPDRPTGHGVGGGRGDGGIKV